MNYLISCTFILFCFIYNTSCETCDDPKFKTCWVVDKSNVAFWIIKCCKAPYKKNEIYKRELGGGEICIEDEHEIFYCCPQHERNLRSKNLCKNSLKEFLKKFKRGRLSSSTSTTTPRSTRKLSTSTTKIPLTHPKQIVPENKTLVVTEIDRLRNRENSSIYEPKTIIATTKEPVIAEEDHKIYFPSAITENSSSPINMENVAKLGKNTSETVATDGHKIPTSNEKVNSILEIDQHGELNQTILNTPNYEMANNFSNGQEKAPIDSSNEFSNIPKINETSKHPQITENSTTTTESSITPTTKSSIISEPSIVTENITLSIINITTPQPKTTTTVRHLTKSEQSKSKF